MTYQVDVGSRVVDVTVRRDGDRLLVDAGGRTSSVDVRRVEAGRLSLLVAPEGVEPTRSIDVGLAERNGAGALDVHLEGRTIPVVVRQGGAFVRRRDGAAAAGPGPQRVVAPMPGRVVRVLVREGDEVRARQGLVVVEAMKMENELRAGRDGRVREVAVTEGQSVEAGATLVVIA